MTGGEFLDPTSIGSSDGVEQDISQFVVAQCGSSKAEQPQDFLLVATRWTFWFVISAGALLSGFAGASGYYAGSWPS